MSGTLHSRHRRSISRLVHAGLAALLLQGPAIASSIPDELGLTPYTAQYRAVHGGISAEGSRSLEPRPDGLWLASNEARLLLFRLQESSIVAADHLSLRPVRYRLSHPFRRDRSADWLFDWDAGIVSDRGQQGWSAPLQSPLFDPLSYQLQLQMDACASPEKGSTWQYPVIDRGRVRLYDVRLEGQEILDTAVGRLETLHLIQTRQGREREIHIWLAQDWHCLLVRLEQSEDDDDPDQRLELLSASVDGRRVKGLD